jgi:thiazole synthase ThiGH ThiG subunit
MPMTINDNTVTVSVQTSDRRTLLPRTVELVRAAEQLVDAGSVGRGGERT